MKSSTVWAMLVVLGALSVFAPPISSEVELGESRDEPGFAPTVPNPASAYCEKLGGITRAVDADHWGGASLGLCRLNDDGLIADWTLFRAAFGDVNEAVNAFLAGRWTPMSDPIENWAALHCVAAGGQVAEYREHLRPDSVVRLCEFSDASRIEVWTLFAGPSFYPELARALAPVASTGLVFRPCPWPRTCMAPCVPDDPPTVFCLTSDDDVETTTFACCCCGTGVNSYAPMP